MTTARLPSLFAALAALVALACTSESGTSPLTTATTTDPGTAGAGGTAPLPDAGARVRTVEMRDPFGGPTGNLLFDGDFDLTTPGLSQAPWYAQASDGSQVELRLETGGLCRTGLRCGVVESKVLLIGFGVAAAASGVAAEVWARPPAGKPCKVVQARLLNGQTFSNLGFLARVSEEPGPDGWCLYRGAVKQQKMSVYLALNNTLAAGETALVDSATLLPDDGTHALAFQSPGEPPSGEEQARLEAARVWLEGHRLYGAPPARPRRDPR
ncbi:MAG: hypothetical protein IT373_14735 [Polyangiaceae bacterium]|nr:hypothetical protein [Polyangiaceae bacterium]